MENKNLNEVENTTYKSDVSSLLQKEAIEFVYQYESIHKVQNNYH